MQILEKERKKKLPLSLRGIPYSRPVIRNSPPPFYDNSKKSPPEIDSLEDPQTRLSGIALYR